MEMWEHPEARLDNLVLMASRSEVESGDTLPALASLRKLLVPDNAAKVKGRLVFGVNGYDDDPRDLWEIPEVRSWMQKLDSQFPYWLYFMDTGPVSTLAFIAFSLCRYEKVPGGKMIPRDELQRFLVSHFIAMNQLSQELNESQEENDERSREINGFFFPERQDRESGAAR